MIDWLIDVWSYIDKTGFKSFLVSLLSQIKGKLKGWHFGQNLLQHTWTWTVSYQVNTMQFTQDITYTNKYLVRV